AAGEAPPEVGGGPGGGAASLAGAVAPLARRTARTGRPVFWLPDPPIRRSFPAARPVASLGDRPRLQRRARAGFAPASRGAGPSRPRAAPGPTAGGHLPPLDFGARDTKPRRRRQTRTSGGEIIARLRRRRGRCRA